MDNKDLLIANGYKKFDIEIAVGSYEEVPQLDPDLMHIRFVMCHEGENSNGDTFTKDVLINAQDTPRYKPVDWEHGQPIVGHILDSMYKEDASGLGYIEATGVIWKFIYPELSQQIKAKASTGELKLSMECYYKDANYKIGDQILDQQQAENMGIIPYVGREYMGKRVARVFKEVIFGGVGVVAKPADKNAVFLSVAKDLQNQSAIQITSDMLGDNMMITSGTISGTIITAATSPIKPVNDFNNKLHNDETVNAVVVARFVKAFDKAKSSVVSKFNTKTLKTKDQVVAEVRSSIQTLLSEVSSISEAYYKGTASEDLFLTMRNEVEKYSIALNSELTEAYLETVNDDHILYNIVNYSDDSVMAMKAHYTVDDNGIAIDFTNATQLATREETSSMAKENEVVAGNEEVVDQASAADSNKEDVNVDIQAEFAAKASEYEAKISALEADLLKANETNSALEAKASELEQRLAQIEADKLVDSRLAELKEIGIVFSESRLEKEQAKLRGMNDEAYADYKELLIEVAGSKVESEQVSTSEEAVEGSQASEEEVEEEILVEGAKASELNIETPQEKRSRPFGHLVR